MSDRSAPTGRKRGYSRGSRFCSDVIIRRTYRAAAGIHDLKDARPLLTTVRDLVMSLIGCYAYQRELQSAPNGDIYTTTGSKNENIYINIAI